MLDVHTYFPFVRCLKDTAPPCSVPQASRPAHDTHATRRAAASLGAPAEPGLPLGGEPLHCLRPALRATEGGSGAAVTHSPRGAVRSGRAAAAPGWQGLAASKDTTGS